jgi:hypothetical protein
MKSFQITIDIRATRINNPFDMKVTRNIDVDDDRNLDEIMDIPIGKLILGSAYEERISKNSRMETIAITKTGNTSIENTYEAGNGNLIGPF